jgi:hypothetical protein
MKPAPLLLGTAALALALSGCGLEGERPNIWLQNNSDQPVTLHMLTTSGPLLSVTAKAHTTEWSSGSPPKDGCLINWEIVDTSGKVLKKIDKVCAYDTVVYP